MAPEIPLLAEAESGRGAIVTAELDANVAVVIVNYRTPRLAIECLASLRSEKGRMAKLRAIVVDGGSGDDSAAQISRVARESDYKDWVSVLPLEINGGFGWANNQAILKLAKENHPPDYIYLLNPDAQAIEGATAALVLEMRRHPDCGAAGSLILRPDGRSAASAFRFPLPWRELIDAAGSEKLGRLLGIAPTVVAAGCNAAVDWVSGASVMFRAEALRSSGLFDDGFFLYFEEVELMHRLTQLGWTVRHVPESKVVHIEGASTGMGTSAAVLPPYWFESRQRYFGLTGGHGPLAMANIARLVGRAMREVKDMGQHRRIEPTTVKRPKRFIPSFAQWGDEPGKPPAWMVKQ